MTNFFRSSMPLILLMNVCLALSPASAPAEENGALQILLIGDSTTEGSIPRILKPEGPPLESALEHLLQANGSLPPCKVINSTRSSENYRVGSETVIPILPATMSSPKKPLNF